MKNRKDEHVELALNHHRQQADNDFEKMRFIHHSLHSIDVDDVNTATQIGQIQLDTPFYINAMTGGSERTKEINRKLAQVAAKADIAMAVGSMSQAFRDPNVWDSFLVVREENPDGVVFANLNANASIEMAETAVKRLNARALQIHINAAQEVVMPEGDRKFKHWPEHISAIVGTLPVDVIVKEVGFGMSRETVRQLTKLGVKIVDVSGRGGTNFSKIENSRRESVRLDYLNAWGQSTLESLLEARVYNKTVDLIASGGMRSPMDMVKAFSLGARAVGLSAAILRAVTNDGVDRTVERIVGWKDDLKLLMALLGASKLSDLSMSDFVLSSDIRNYCQSRGIEL